MPFNKPKKDSCDLRAQFVYANETEKELLVTEYERHLINKNKAREKKLIDKTLSQTLDCHVTVAFDLQHVLLLPRTTESSLYYSRKLNNCNLTIYLSGNGNGYSYQWNEPIAKRGSNEVASCLLKFFELLNINNVSSVTLYSDNCAGQNQNIYIVTLYWYCIRKFGFKSIHVVHKYLEKYATLIQTARRKNPIPSS